MNLHCSDGDADCDQVKQLIVVCPGTNFCVDQPINCVTPSVCVSDGTCDPFCDPATIPACDRCIGDGNPANEGGACSEAGGQVCLGGVCVQCTSAAQCATLPSAPVDCQLPNTCSAGNTCVAGGTAPAGTVCSNGVCDGTGIGPSACQFQACDPCEANCGQSGGPDFNPSTCNQSITLGCTNNVTTNVSILPWQLTANPTTILSGQAFSVQYGGAAVFSEFFLDAGLATVPGLKQAELISAVATAQVRSGATGANVPLNAQPVPTTCSGGMNAGLACTTADDCPPGAPYVACGQYVQIPIINGIPITAGGCSGAVANCDCSPCSSINATKAAQCTANGYCIAPGGLSIPLQTPVGNYTAAASGQVLIGFQDVGTGATIAPDGTYILPAASFPAPAAPNGVRVIASVLQVALQCTMAVDSGAIPPAPVTSSPTPSSLLSRYNIQVP
jgi:hypothetical protein